MSKATAICGFQKLSRDNIGDALELLGKEAVVGSVAERAEVLYNAIASTANDKTRLVRRVERLEMKVEELEMKVEELEGQLQDLEDCLNNNGSLSFFSVRRHRHNLTIYIYIHTDTQ
jgi:chromosome segregation ATPase